MPCCARSARTQTHSAESTAAVAKAARDLVIKRLKAKSLAVDDARAVREAVGHDMFDRIVDGMSAAHLKSIVTKLDKHHPDMKGSSAQWQRQHLQTLLEGAAEPAQKAAKSNKAGSRTKTAEACHQPRSAFAPRR